MIVFHSPLFHYGDKSHWNGNDYQHDIMAFSYLHEESFKMDEVPITCPADVNCWCYGCEAYTSIVDHLKN